MPRPVLPVHPLVAEVTERVAERSRASRTAYLSRISAAAAERGLRPARTDLGCSNLAHAVAACGGTDRAAMSADSGASVGIVTSYNDMLSAHAPFEHYPQAIKADRPRRRRGRPGGWGRAGDVRRHHAGAGRHGAQPVQPRRHRDVDRDRPVARRLRRRPDARRLRQDRPRPGRRCPDLRAPAHRPRARPAHGLGTLECREGRGAKARSRTARAGREELLAVGGRVVPLARAPARSTARPTPTSCSWTSWACTCPAPRSCTPTSPLRAALTDAATRRVVEIAGSRRRPYGIGEVVDEKVVVNGVVALLATGGSTNHTMHLISMAAAAGVHLTWDDFDDLSRGGAAAGPHVPQRARRREPLPRGRRHALPRAAPCSRQGCSTRTCGPSPVPGSRRYAQRPVLDADGALVWEDVPPESGDLEVLRPAHDPFCGRRRPAHAPRHASATPSSRSRRSPKSTASCRRRRGCSPTRSASSPRSPGASSTATSSWSSASRGRRPTGCPSCTR